MTKNSSGEATGDRLAEKVREILKKSGNCAQTSFAVLQEEFGLEGEQILKALTPFPGIALRGETCGAVIGCLMALGLVFGRDDLGDFRGYIRSLPSARRFCTRFEEENGGTACAGILVNKLGRNYNLADRAEAREYASAGGPKVCSELIISAVKIAAEAIGKKK
jgi:C_GCAxxG_C_C family probable redox protein